MARESVSKTFLVATLVCIICSVLVSSAAVGLRSQQEFNKERDKRKNILQAAGIYDPEREIKEQFQQIESRIVDLSTGEYVDESTVDPATFDQRQAARTEGLSIPIKDDADLAGIGRREKYAFVYLVQNGSQLEQVILPIYGKGLWSTLYGFLAIKNDLDTVNGITFYEHAETPGLGGEVDNPRWKAQWEGKKLFGPEEQPRIQVIKGTVDPDEPESKYQIDGLSGATITSRGVSQLVRYWIGEDAFGPFLEKLRERRDG